jgi:hypothetical protein
MLRTSRPDECRTYKVTPMPTARKIRTHAAKTSKARSPTAGDHGTSAEKLGAGRAGQPAKASTRSSRHRSITAASENSDSTFRRERSPISSLCNPEVLKEGAACRRLHETRPRDHRRRRRRCGAAPDRQAAVPQRLDLALVEVETEHMVAPFSKAGAGDKATYPLPATVIFMRSKRWSC